MYLHPRVGVYVIHIFRTHRHLQGDSWGWVEHISGTSENQNNGDKYDVLNLIDVLMISKRWIKAFKTTYILWDKHPNIYLVFQVLWRRVPVGELTHSQISH